MRPIIISAICIFLLAALLIFGKFLEQSEKEVTPEKEIILCKRYSVYHTDKTIEWKTYEYEILICTR